MLIGLSGYMTGYNGTFAFSKPGDKYLDHNYVGMRVFCASLGSLVVPFMFSAVYDLSKSLYSATIAACLLIFDVGFITLSQYILLDPLLLFFISGAFMGSVKVTTAMRDKPFRIVWWFWLCFTGVFLSGAVSVKFVGLFIVAVVGLQTIADLWDIMGDLNVTMIDVGKHFVARVVTLIILPSILYVIYFYIHLKVLSKSGSGDGFFSSGFQSTLEGNSLYNASLPREVAYGSVITLKNIKTGGGYLHSHWHLYPEGVGARQQQITGYSHKDDNNKWIMKKYDSDYNQNDDVQIVKDGHLVRLQHWTTGRNIHSHREPAPVTKRHFQVTGYGENGTGDANDVWKIEIISDNSASSSTSGLKTVTTSFRLIHYFVGCALSCNTKQLPKWGYEQMEISCNPNVLDRSTEWIVEDNYFPRLPNVSFDLFAPSFLSKFLESHAVMFQGNSGLKPKEGEVTSRPWQWPINVRGQFFSGNEYKIYLLGNPLVWWGNLVFLAIYCAIQVIIFVENQRNSLTTTTSSYSNDSRSRFTTSGSWLFIAWFIHYFPFYSMGRVLYYHHYFPAAIFSSCLSAVLIDYVLSYLKDMFRVSVSFIYCILVALLSILFYSFLLFSPLSYGILSHNNVADINMTSSVTNSLQNLKWLDSWEF